jgi:hypothetical protein
MNPVAEKYKNKISPFGKKARLKTFISTPESDVFLYHPHMDGTFDLRQIRGENADLHLDRADFLLRFDRREFETRLVFAQMKSEDGIAFDLSLFLQWKIMQPREFLREFGISRLKTTSTIDPVAFESRLLELWKAPLSDEMGRVLYEDLQDPAVLPEKWWNLHWDEWRGDEFGWLKLCKVSETRYDSPEADRLEEVRAQEKLLRINREEEIQQKAQEAEAERRKLALAGDLEKMKMDQALSEAERKKKVELIRFEHEKALLDARAAMEVQKLESEKERAKLEAEIASIRNHGEEVEERLRRAETAEQETRQMLAAIKQARNEIDEAHKTMQAAAVEGIAANLRLSAHAVSTAPETLVLTGQDKGAKYLCSLARANTASGAIRVKKLALGSRDIGTRRVNTLAIGSSLEFSLASRREGFVTILNIGTSGAVYLLAPNGLVKPQEARIEAAQEITFPGPPLLPGLPLYENGPPGWEEMLVIVSQQPLFDYNDLASASAEQPELCLSDDEIDKLAQKLGDMPQQDWRAGVLGFLVE